MASRIDAMPTGPVVNPATGEMELEWRDFFEEVVFGQSENSIGTILSGVETAQAQVDGITEGSQENASEGLASEFTVTPSQTNLVKSGFGSNVSTDAITVSISGGTPPYSIAYASVGLAPFTSNGPASLGADGDISVFWSRTVADDRFYSGQQKITVTDSAGSPMTSEALVSVSMFDPSIDGIGAA